MITEEWQIQVGKNKHIVSDAEMKLILNAGEARFVQLKGLIVNPAFVSDMVFLRKVNNNQLPSGKVYNLTEEEIDRTALIRKKIKNNLKSNLL